MLWWLFLAAGLLGVIFLSFPRTLIRFQTISVLGIAIVASFFSAGGLLAWHHDTRNAPGWFGRFYGNGDRVLVTLSESLIEKNRSVKSDAKIESVIDSHGKKPADGKLILYFEKDSLPPGLQMGARLVIEKPLQEIKNAGNPGGFDYKRYCLFRGITHQVFLRPGDYCLIPGGQEKWLQRFLSNTRNVVLNALRENIPGEKELGLAEALLIGYKEDLDKTLVQSYSNTGVVHIIAISGLHLGLIYWLLLVMLRPLQKRRFAKWMSPLLVMAGLWLFTLLAGAQPSILRSALMFTCIVLAESVSRSSNIYNNLALSAFILLCINPYWLWDVGFQLSYAAVLSIVVFMKPIYNLIYVKNKLLDLCWKMNAVTIAAQLLTIPISIYHFHQFPVYFLLTNFVAVPLSSLVLLAEIFLCAVSFIPFLAGLAGQFISWLIGIMNAYIGKVERLPFSTWEGLQIDVWQTVLLYLFTAATGCWLIERKKQAFRFSLIVLVLFASIRAGSFWQATRQRKLIIYNVPQRLAIDIVDGRNYSFMGDPVLSQDDYLKNFHLKPCRTRHRLHANNANTLTTPPRSLARIGNKNILFITGKNIGYHLKPGSPVDLVIVYGNPNINFQPAFKEMLVKQVVFNANTSPARLKYWKRDCDSLHIPYHDVREKGAFVMNLN